MCDETGLSQAHPSVPHGSLRLTRMCGGSRDRTGDEMGSDGTASLSQYMVLGRTEWRAVETRAWASQGTRAHQAGIKGKQGKQ